MLNLPWDLLIFEASFSVMAVDPMRLGVSRAPPVKLFLLVLRRSGSLGGLDCQLAIEGFNPSLKLAGCLFYGRHVRVLGFQMVGVFSHLGC